MFSRNVGVSLREWPVATYPARRLFALEDGTDLADFVGEEAFKAEQAFLQS